MTRIIPYPWLAFGLVTVWLLLNGFSLGQLVLGIAVALVAGRVMAALQPAKPRLRRWQLAPRLLGIVTLDIIRSNIAVTRLIVTGAGPKYGSRTSGFVDIPLELRDQIGLAILSIIITATPGTAWIEYDHARSRLLLHVFDLIDPDEMRALIKNRYEHLLMEIFQ
ncbi:MAG: Na+/H+ antiporter subunit E [Gemmobacter sp.]